MKIIFRWYGFNDKITLDRIRQIPAIDGVVTAVYDIPVGEVWDPISLKEIVQACNDKGLECKVIESVPVHEDIKLGASSAKQYIENYKENLRILGRLGFNCVCYNFMPVFDWLRSDLKFDLEDGSNALAYNHDTVLSLDPNKTDLVLPGWDASYSKDELQILLEKYKSVDDKKLWENLYCFLAEIIPVAIESGINMAIHPDDPPWGIFGLPRIITSAQSIKKLFGLIKHPANGLTFCTGSFGASKLNDLLEIINVAKGRIHFAHLRNIRRSNSFDFCETAHPSKCGDIDMYLVLKGLLKAGFDGYVRPDHGRMIWGEQGRGGYGLYDRALGASYIYGLWEAITKGGYND
ncbi:MAG: mannonate dehydratase [Christensenellaceae bacterium]|jgi:mannonate dehydratase|nr:mannonate dehydratase [Christensenellaceae bacterium]